MPEQSEIKLHALDYWQVLRNRFPVIMLIFFLVFMTALVIAYLRPSEYLGRVQLQVQREANELEVFRETGAMGPSASAPKWPPESTSDARPFPSSLPLGGRGRPRSFGCGPGAHPARRAMARAISRRSPHPGPPREKPRAR